LVDTEHVVPVEEDAGGFEGELGLAAIDEPLEEGGHGAFVKASTEGEGAPEEAVEPGHLDHHADVEGGVLGVEDDAHFAALDFLVDQFWDLVEGEGGVPVVADGFGDFAQGESEGLRRTPSSKSSQP
jgi:hypothetical protein